MGLAHVYGFLTYALIFILCLAFVPQITVNIAGLLAIVLSAAMMVGFNYYAFPQHPQRVLHGQNAHFCHQIRL